LNNRWNSLFSARFHQKPVSMNPFSPQSRDEGPPSHSAEVSAIGLTPLGSPRLY
jgi:hypothetical protein